MTRTPSYPTPWEEVFRIASEGEMTLKFERYEFVTKVTVTRYYTAHNGALRSVVRHGLIGKQPNDDILAYELIRVMEKARQRLPDEHKGT